MEDKLLEAIAELKNQLDDIRSAEWDSWIEETTIPPSISSTLPTLLREIADELENV